jgi:AraC-like DNA-binding protein
MDDAELPAPRTVYRTMGRGAPWDRIGAGVMDKGGLTIDQRDYLAPTWSMVYVLRGRGEYADAAGRRWELEPGMCFQRVPERRHSTTLDPRGRWLEAFIDVGPTLWRALQAMQVLRPDPPVWRWGLSRERVARFEALIGDLERAGERRLPALCVRLLGLAVEAQPEPAEPGGGDDAIERACRALAEESTRRTDLRAWCRRERLDYERFRKDFLRRMGVSPGQYRLRRRMDRACELLHTTDRTLAEIAAELGYRSPYEFSAQFRERMGLPPSRYRMRGR